MLRRQFSGNRLLDQLQTRSAKRRFENAEQPVNQSQLFSNATDTVDSLLTDLQLEALAVANILARIKPAQIYIYNDTPITLVSDYDDSITKWAAGVIEHACAELLTQENTVKPDFLSAFPVYIASGLTAEALVLSYFHALKSSFEELVKQKLLHVNNTNVQHGSRHVENVYVIFDKKTQAEVLLNLIKQEFKKRNPSENQTENLTASMLTYKKIGYHRVSWALGWQSPAIRPGAKQQAPTVKVTP